MPTENILVVEDEENIQELIRYHLAKEGYQVTCVPSGEKGLGFKYQMPVHQPCLRDRTRRGVVPRGASQGVTEF